MAKKYIKWFLCGVVAILFLCMAIVVLFDPFFQYHKPLPGLKAVLSDKEYQCVGTLKTFEYDSVIAGSSVAENYNNRWFDEGFDCTSIKAIRSYGATADLCYLLDKAFEEQEPKIVYYLSMEFLMGRSLKTNLYNLGMPDEVAKALKKMDVKSEFHNGLRITDNEGELIEITTDGIKVGGEDFINYTTERSPQSDAIIFSVGGVTIRLEEAIKSAEEE